MPRKRHKPTDEISGLVIAEQAVHLLCRTPLHLWAGYYVGSIPFVMGLLFFWSDMSRSAFAQQRCFMASLGLAGLFIWMKCWHAVFADGLRLLIIEAPRPAFSGRKLLRLVAIQTATQPFGLIALPVALLITIPFLHVYTFYQYITVNSLRDESGLNALCRDAWKHALLWQRQNLLINWLFNPWLFGVGLALVFTATRLVVSTSPILASEAHMLWFLLAIVVTFHFLLPFSPMGCIAAGNIATFLFLLPALLHSFLGIQTVFMLSGWHSVFNTTFLMTVFGLTYLCMDPIMKAAYAMRCFHADARHSGADLILRLKSARRAIMLLLGVLCFWTCCGIVQADDLAEPLPPATIEVDQMDATIDDVLTQPEYAWRMPREAARAAAEHGFLWHFMKQMGEHIEKLFKKLVRLLNKLARWLDKHFGHRTSNETTSVNWQDPVRALLFIFMALVASILAVFIYRLWKQRTGTRGVVTARAVQSVPDLTDEKVTADLLPADEWMLMAQELIAQGQLRLAARAMFLGGLATLAHHKLVTIASSKSNYEYLRELERHAHDRPEMLSSFSGTILMFERVWYGSHEMTPEALAVYTTGMEGILHGA
ncbi:MAG: DUF4129 domain-containing protein [Spartobacteria bacterium]|nr:DUF4129 domain-containing protein [Spartobacteria bacterium]